MKSLEKYANSTSENCAQRIIEQEIHVKTRRIKSNMQISDSQFSRAICLYISRLKLYRWNVFIFSWCDQRLAHILFFYVQPILLSLWVYTKKRGKLNDETTWNCIFPLYLLLNGYSNAHIHLNLWNNNLLKCNFVCRWAHFLWN